MKPLAAAALSALTFAAGIWIGPKLPKLAAQFSPESQPRCLMQTRICVGQPLAYISAADSDLAFRGAVCVSPLQGTYRSLGFPDFLQRLCPGGIESVNFSRPGRWYSVRLRDGLVTGIDDRPDVTLP